MKILKYVLITVLAISIMIATFGCGGGSSDTDATLSPEENDAQLESYKQEAASIRESIEESQGYPMFHDNGDED